MDTLNKKTVRELKALARRKRIQLPTKGSGSKGGVLKKDIVKAISDATQQKSKKPQKTKKPSLPSAYQLKRALVTGKQQRGIQRVRFFVDEFVYVPSTDSFEVKLWDQGTHRYIYATTKLNKPKTHKESAQRSTQEKFVNATANPNNIYFSEV